MQFGPWTILFGIAILLVANVMLPSLIRDFYLFLGFHTLIMGSALIGAFFLLSAHFARSVERQEAIAQQVLEGQEELLHRLVRVAQLRDGETGSHIVRMARYAQLVALSLGWTEERAEVLFRAAQLHDIGKIGISDSILLKEGPLTPEERRIMETHVQVGVRILTGGNSEMLQMAERIALTHHERYAGGGYPMGLIGDQIPVEGRIAALCDVFDALVSKRPYKAAWSFEEAVQEIRSQRGQHFDPEIVDAFFGCLPAIRAIVDEHTAQAGEALRLAS